MLSNSSYFQINTRVTYILETSFSCFYNRLITVISAQDLCLVAVGSKDAQLRASVTPATFVEGETSLVRIKALLDARVGLHNPRVRLAE